MTQRDSKQRRAARLAADNRQLLLRLTLSAVVMFGFGFLLVPFYEKICEVTGINNLLQPDRIEIGNTQIDTTRTVLVQFDANLHDLPWRFQPQQRRERRLQLPAQPFILEQLWIELRFEQLPQHFGARVGIGETGEDDGGKGDDAQYGPRPAGPPGKRARQEHRQQ